MSCFKSQTIVVLGGSSGIGYAVALASLQLHASSVIIASSTPGKVQNATTRLQEAVKEGNLPGTVKGETVDVKDAEQVKNFFADLGQIDHVVFTAGDYFNIGFKNEDIENLKRSIFVHFPDSY